MRTKPGGAFALGLAILCACSRGGGGSPPASFTGVFTQRYDAQRTGQNRQEFILTPSGVNGLTFSKLFSCAVDGEVYAQPLYVANFAIAAATHNVVLVATQNDSVYAFDADASPCVQYWQTSFLGTGVTTVPPVDTDEPGDINTIIGITGTPVIDPAAATLYVVAKTKETTGCSAPPCYFQRLHALDLATGNEKFGGPADISSAITVAGSGDTGDPTLCPGSAGNVPFCPLRENQRPGLLLLNGTVYIAWASHEDIQPYHGWVIGYNAADLTHAPVLFNTTPNGGLGGIWMTGTGPAADASGNIYVISGNGTFDTAAPRTNYGDSFIKLRRTGGLSVADFFTPFNESSLDVQDFDVGSGGAIVLPDSAGSAAHRHLLIGGDKQGVLYVVDRDRMSGFNPGGDRILQKVSVAAGPTCTICGIFSTPAFWEGKLYVVAIGDVLKQYTVANAALSSLPARQASDVFGFPGATPAISSNGAVNGIVWVLDTSNNGTGNSSGNGPAVLFAYDATNLNKLYSSPPSGAGAAGSAVKFTVPTVANGKVYVGTQTELSVFGLLP
jgi:outer membrane protein assembly factor BamB